MIVPAQQETRLYIIVEAIRQLARGRSNATGTVTLRDGETTTTVSNPNVNTGDFVQLMPTTANAAAEVGGLWIETDRGSFTINHADDPATDRTFTYLVMGS